jgi:hypothetical protein
MKMWILDQNGDLLLECHEIYSTRDGFVFANSSVCGGFVAKYFRTFLGRYASEARAKSIIENILHDFRFQSNERAVNFFYEMPKA